MRIDLQPMLRAGRASTAGYSRQYGIRPLVKVETLFLDAGGGRRLVVLSNANGTVSRLFARIGSADRLG